MPRTPKLTIEEAELNKLNLEIDALENNNKWNVKIGRYLPIITTLIAVAGFWFTLNQYTSSQRRAEAQLTSEIKKSNEMREQDFRKSFWQKRVELYFEASSAVSLMANSKDVKQRKIAEDKFWTLFYGPLVIVENSGVSSAMVDVRSFIQQYDGDQSRYDLGELNNLSLNLARQCRLSIAQPWDFSLEKIDSIRSN